MGAREERKEEKAEERELPRPPRTITDSNIFDLLHCKGQTPVYFDAMVEIKLKMNTVKTLGSMIKDYKRSALILSSNAMILDSISPASIIIDHFLSLRHI